MSAYPVTFAQTARQRQRQCLEQQGFQQSPKREITPELHHQREIKSAIRNKGYSNIKEDSDVDLYDKVWYRYC